MPKTTGTKPTPSDIAHVTKPQADALLLAIAVLREDARREERKVQSRPGNAAGWQRAAAERRRAADVLEALVPRGMAFHDVEVPL